MPSVQSNLRAKCVMLQNKNRMQKAESRALITLIQ